MTNGLDGPEARSNQRSWTKVLLRCGAVGGPLFVIAFLVEGATRANYNPLRHPVSSLALGDLGWTQSANFLITGLLMLALAVGVRRALQTRGRGSFWGSLLIGMWAIGLLGAGVFVTDPVSGYPPGTPAFGEHSFRGMLHDIFSLAGFAGLIAAGIVFACNFARWEEKGWAIYSAVSGSLVAIGFVLASVGFTQAEGYVGIAGLVQRVTVAVGFCWLTLLAIHVLKSCAPVLLEGMEPRNGGS